MNYIKIFIKEILYKIIPQEMELYDSKKKHSLELKEIEKRYAIPQEQYPEKIAEQYKWFTGLLPDLNNPKRFNEKIQWRKVYDINPIYSFLTDKYCVREWVKNKIGEEYLIPLLGVWEKASDIDYNLLPDKFVLKTNNGSGTNIIVTDKNKLNKKVANETLDYWLKRPFCFLGYEMHYKDISPLIIAEKYMKPDFGEEDIRDYKFICFNGVPYFCWVDLDRNHGHKRKVYNLNWEPEPWTVGPYGWCDIDIEKPKSFSKMIEIAKVLCKGFAYVRVDLYEIEEKVYFGEMTFTSANGMEIFYPDVWDYKLGELWDINNIQVIEDLVGINNNTN